MEEAPLRLIEHKPITAPMLKPLISNLPGSVQPILLQDNHSRLMQYEADPMHIGQQINQIILNSPDLTTVLPRITGALGEIFQVDACVMIAVANHQFIIETACWYSQAHLDGKLKQEMLLLKHPVLKAILNGIASLTISEVEVGEIWQGFRSHPEIPISTVLAISTWFQGQANGIILLGRSQPYIWGEGEQELLKVVSEQVAIAMNQVQLQHQVQTAFKYQALINQVTSAIRSGGEINQTLQTTINSTAESLRVDRGSILLIKYADPLFKSRAFHNIPKAKVTITCEWFSPHIESQLQESSSPNKNISLLDQSFWLGDSPFCKQVFANAPQPLVIVDKQDLPPIDNNNETVAIFDANTMSAILMVPLESQATVLGFLVLEQNQPRPWQAEELELMNWVSAQISTAIIQNQTLRQVQALVEERTAQLQRSLEVQAKLYEKTRQQVDQLRQLNQLKDEFVSTMSDQLRNPLASMKMAICMLRQPGLPAERQAMYLDILEEKCTQEINLINDLLTLQKLDSHQLAIHPQKVDMKLLIDDLVQSFEEKWADKGLTIAVELPERSLMLQTDPDSLTRILLELLTNAGRYSDPDTKVHLRVTYQDTPQANQIVLTLSNTGRGISASELNHIFDRFRQGQGVTQQAIQGTGLGLALVKSLVQHLNGTIAVSSNPTDDTDSCETAFTLTLPQFFDNSK